jgi:putative ABC transport system ATP-binding protein
MLWVEDLGKAFRSGRGRVAALEEVSFRVERGKTWVAAGTSGSGKTTLLHCVGGLERPDRGRVFCGETELTALGGRALSRFQRRRLGFVFQFGNLLDSLSVRDNLALPLEMNRVAARKRDRRIDELLGDIGLRDAGRALPRELSGGETQRVAFARAIAHGPDLLLADEPTASLDSTTGDRLIHLMRNLARTGGVTLLVATHDPAVMAAADGLLTLRDGKMETEAKS